MFRTGPLLALLFALLLAACAGGKAVPDRPAPGKPAENDLVRGTAWYQKGCYHKSLELLLRAHERFTALDDVPGIAMSLNNIGNVYARIGDPQSAILFFDAAHELYREAGDDGGAVQALANKAAVLLHDQRPDEAEATLDTAEALANRSGIRSFSLMKTRGLLLASQNRVDEAQEKLGEALAACDPENDSAVAAVHYALGSLMRDTNRYEQAVAHFRTALAADRRVGFYNGIADDLLALGTLYQQNGEHAAAAACFQRSIKIYALLDKGEKVTRTLERLEVSAGEAQVDTTLTRHFVSRWLDGEISADPCE